MCRMLIAVGEVNPSWLIDDFILMANDQNAKHENNEDKEFKHGDGWGIVYFENNQPKIYKSIMPCYEDDTIFSFKKIQSPFFILHARKGSVGSVKMENTHPFQHGDYIFCHNGTVKQTLLIDEKFSAQGETDSEQLFLYLLSGISNGIDERIIYDKYSQVKDYKGMNTFITNGAESYIVNWYSLRPRYYTFNILESDKFVLISSEILPHFKGDWKKTANHDIVKLNTTSRKCEIY